MVNERNDVLLGMFILLINFFQRSLWLSFSIDNSLLATSVSELVDETLLTNCMDSFFTVLDGVVKEKVSIAAVAYYY
jgi:hypothetical protein